MNQELSLALQTKQIVGREEELQAIRQAILDQPTTHVLVFRGPAGIGKTRILARGYTNTRNCTIKYGG